MVSGFRVKSWKDMKEHSSGVPSLRWGRVGELNLPKRARKLLMHPSSTLLLRPPVFQGHPSAHPQAQLPARISEFRIPRRILKLCCCLLFGKWNAEQTHCHDGFACQREISIKVLFKGMLSQHNACQNCLSLMKSSVCLWVAPKTANYFLPFQVPDKKLKYPCWFAAC